MLCASWSPRCERFPRPSPLPRCPALLDPRRELASYGLSLAHQEPQVSVSPFSLVLVRPSVSAVKC